MKPELLLSVDSERRFWLDPRTKLYMLVIFSIVMIDGKTDGISLVKAGSGISTLFPPAFGQEEKDCYHLFNCFYCFVDGKCVSCSVYGINRNNYNIAVGSIWDKMVSKRHDGLLSSLDYKG